MAQSLTIESGSVLNGNPITFLVEPNIVTDTDAQDNTIYPSFHRVVVEVQCGMTGGNYEILTFSAPVEKEESHGVTVDISSALRTFRDTYEYTPNAATYPLVKFNVKAYDEYLLNGEIHSNVDPVWFPSDPNDNSELQQDASFLCTLFGGFSDAERLNSTSGTKSLRVLSKKPTDTPEIVAVGETFAYTPNYSAAKTLEESASLTAPQSSITNITTSGLQTIGTHTLFALPASAACQRQVFRFINSLGVLESVSVPKTFGKHVKIQTDAYGKSIQEKFHALSRSFVKKSHNVEMWSFASDPLTEAWMYWYVHEFLMSEHVWIELQGVFSPCSLITDDEVVLFDVSERKPYRVSFSVRLDINGSPFL